MGALLPFQFDGAPVRVLEIDGAPWFVGRDVAERLGYVDPTNAMKQHCRGVVKRHPIVDALGRDQEARLLSEPDVFRLIVGSKLPAAERFERWLFEEVLPTLRRTGGYAPEGERQAAQLRLVAECRRTFGRQAARRLWADLGLPAVSEPQEPPRLAPAQAPLVDRVEAVVRRAGGGGITRSALYRRFDGRCRAAELTAALTDLLAAGRITASRPAGASIGRPSVTYHPGDVTS